MTRPVPHIGTTAAQRRAQIAHCQRLAAQADRERLDQHIAALQVDAELDRIRRSDLSGCAEPDPAPKWSGLLAVFASDMALSLIALAVWFLAGMGIADIYFLIRGWLS